MKFIQKASLALLVILAMTIVLGSTVFAEQYPKATGYFNDFAKLLTNDEGKSLNDELIAFEKSTGYELTVVTVESLNIQTAEQYAKGIATEWGVGKKGVDNGVIFLIALAQRQMWVQPASGARDVLPQDAIESIRDNIIIPELKHNDWGVGITKGAEEIMKVMRNKGDYENGSVPQARPLTSQDIATILTTLAISAISIILILLLSWIIIRKNAKKYVKVNLPLISSQSSKTVSKLDHIGVSSESKSKLEKILNRISNFDRDISDGNHIHWRASRDYLLDLFDDLSEIDSHIDREIKKAEEMIEKAPELLKSIPKDIKAAQAKIAKGKFSKRARNHLGSAKKYYNKAMSQYARYSNSEGGITPIHWLMLYAILSNANNRIANAEQTHHELNHPESNYHSSYSSSSSSSSYGFGDSGGFGGGGGFSGGGGAGGGF